MSKQLPNLSFEFFPPKTEKGLENLIKTAEELAEFEPDFFSVTYGAGGSTQAGTKQAVGQLLQAGYKVMPHLSCIGSSREELFSIIEDYLKMGVKSILALRGDLPSGLMDVGEFAYATNLVEFIRSEFGDVVEVVVAAYPEKHPQTKSFKEDIEHFITKANAGADSAITQYFFNSEAYFNFVKMLRGRTEIPVIPGIMPITNYTKLARFSSASGADLPRWLAETLKDYEDESQEMHELGTAVVVDLCKSLIASGTKNLHFYTLNQAKPSKDILQKLAKHIANS